MEGNGDQGMVVQDNPGSNDQEHIDHDVGMEESEDYYYEGDDYRHFPPRGRGGFRYKPFDLVFSFF